MKASSLGMGRNVSWSVLAQVGRQAGTFITTVILARYLTPGEFGLIGMATVFTGLMSVINDVGVNGALIQKRDISKSHFSTMFWMNQAVGISLLLTTILTSGAIQSFYSSDGLSDVLNLLSLIFIFGSLGAVQQSIRVRNMEFKILSIIELISVTLSCLIAVLMARLGYGVWSIVAQMVAMPFLTTLMLWMSSDWRPRLEFNCDSVKDLLPFGLSVAGFNVVNFITRNVDYLLVGKFLGASALGYYTLAYRLMMYPLQAITFSVSKVLFSALSKLESNRDEFQRVYLRVVTGVSLATFPMMCGIFVVSSDFVALIFGPDWEEVGYLLRILAVAGLFQSIGATVGPLYQSLGKPNIQLRMAIINAICTTCVILLSVDYGLKSVALAYSVFSVIWVIFSLRVASYVANISYFSIFLCLRKAAFGSLSMVAVMTYIDQFLPKGGYVGLVLQVLIGILVIAVMMFVVKVLCWSGGRIRLNV